ncbi:MAG TPA: hypothetical protein VNZ86_01225, partial [Bacteroidia bacterium]|nr:hypothetical protein [Bacteroidia bacterium]
GATDFIEKDENLFHKTTEKIREALCSYDKGEVPFRSGKNKGGITAVDHKIHRPTRLFFAPITLPETGVRKVVPLRKKKGKKPGYG